MVMTPPSSPSLTAIFYYVFALGWLLVFYALYGHGTSHLVAQSYVGDDSLQTLIQDKQYVIVDTTTTATTTTVTTIAATTEAVDVETGVVFYSVSVADAKVVVSTVLSFCGGKKYEGTVQLRKMEPLSQSVAKQAPFVFAYKLFVTKALEPSPVISAVDPAIDRYISAELKSGGGWERNVFSFMVKSLSTCSRATSVVIDVGTNIGSHSLAPALDGWHVVSFEMAASNIQRLRETAALNEKRITRWTIINAAVSDSTGANMTAVSGGAENHSNFYVAEGGGGLPVVSVKLDDVVPGLIGDTMDVAYLKVDVESFEPRVIAGAVELICSRKVFSIVLEMDKVHGQPACKWESMLRWLQRLGYTLYHDRVPPVLIQVSYWRGRRIWDSRLGANVYFVLENRDVSPGKRLGERCFPQADD